MKQYELETGTLMFLELPSDAHGFSYFNSQLLYYSNICEDNKMGYELIHIGDGFKPLSLFSQLKEEDVKEVMPYRFEDDYFKFFNYLKNKYSFKYAKESIHSLAQHLVLDTTQPIFVIFKPKQKCKCTDEQSWNCIECIKPR